VTVVILGLINIKQKKYMVTEKEEKKEKKEIKSLKSVIYATLTRL
jgi:hypothetical protein